MKLSEADARWTGPMHLHACRMSAGDRCRAARLWNRWPTHEDGRPKRPAEFLTGDELEFAESLGNYVFDHPCPCEGNP